MHTSRSHLVLAVLAAAFAVIFSACHSSKNTATTEPRKTADKNWTTLYAPVNVRLAKPMSLSLSGRATMKKDQYIHVSMRVLGMEVAALYLNSDSMFFVDKYHRYLFAEPLAELLGERYADLGVGDIQQIILGQKVLPRTQTVNIEPSGFVETPAGMVASELAIYAETPKTDIDALLSWKPSDGKWNEENRSVDFKVPSNYQRITLDNLKSMLKTAAF